MNDNELEDLEMDNGSHRNEDGDSGEIGHAEQSGRNSDNDEDWEDELWDGNSDMESNSASSAGAEELLKHMHDL
jgi:hypothetical protein